MKKNSKQGFTLIELLAVIVILAIIALITVPIVLMITANVQKKADERSVANYLHAVELTIASKNTEEDFRPQECQVEEDGNLDCDGVKVTVKSKGDHPNRGFVTIDEWSVDNYKVYLREKEYSNITPAECFEVSKNIEYAHPKYTFKIDYDRCMEYYSDVLESESNAEIVCKGGGLLTTDTDGVHMNIELLRDAEMNFYNPGSNEYIEDLIESGVIIKEEIGGGYIYSINYQGCKDYYNQMSGETTLTPEQEVGREEFIDNLCKGKDATTKDESGNDITINLNNQIQEMIDIPGSEDFLSSMVEQGVLTRAEDQKQFNGTGTITRYYCASNNVIPMSLDNESNSALKEYSDVVIPKKLPINQLVDLHINIDKCVEVIKELDEEMSEEEIKQQCQSYSEEFETYDLEKKKEMADMYNQYGGMTDSKYEKGEEVVITGIGAGSFYRKEIYRVKLPKSITKIGRNAFEHSTLSDINLPDGITRIEPSTFANASLTKIKIPNSVITIGIDAFSGNRLESISIPDTVKSIGIGAFSGNRLKNVKLPNNLHMIQGNSFDDNELTSITLPESLYEIGYYSFAYNQLNEINLPDNIRSIGHRAFYENNLKTVKIPSYVTVIASEVFAHNQLETVELHDDIDYIRNYAFADNNLKNLVIPDSVTQIEYRAFEFNQLESVKLPSGIYGIESYAFANNKLKAISIPEKVSHIDSYAFSNNQLTNLVLPEKVDSVGTYAFANNPLESVKIYHPKSDFSYWAYSSSASFGSFDTSKIEWLGES